eukprot:1139184-Pelagomonas_calceolata.AAC.6
MTTSLWASFTECAWSSLAKLASLLVMISSPTNTKKDVEDAQMNPILIEEEGKARREGYASQKGRIALQSPLGAGLASMDIGSTGRLALQNYRSLNSAIRPLPKNEEGKTTY